MLQKNIYLDLSNYIEGRSKINCHSHNLQDEFFKDYDLDTLINNTYINARWTGLQFDGSYKSRQEFLDKVRYKSYFIWLQKSLQKIYETDRLLTADNWDYFSDRIKEAYKDDKANINILKHKCRYEKVILDAYWDPGSDSGHKGFFTPTFRVNMFNVGYDEDAKDYKGLNAVTKYKKHINDIEEYIAFVRETIILEKSKGCVALKSAIPYERGLDITRVSKEEAQKAFKQDEYTVTERDIKAFQDYVIFEICKIAAELNMPFQWHTGLGVLKNTSAMYLYELISKNPDTKFVLFHGSYPWMDDMAGLLHYFKNVYCDICWLPIISPSAAERMIHELIEVGTSDKICWGCDTWTAEESYGAVLAVSHVLANVLRDKVNNNYLSENDAMNIIDNILYNNPRKLYNYI